MNFNVTLTYGPWEDIQYFGVKNGNCGLCNRKLFNEGKIAYPVKVLITSEITFDIHLNL